MSSNNYEKKILDAIEMLVDNAVSKANYDKTIKGIVSKCANATLGKYVIKYQNSSFYAFAADSDASYKPGTMVYVLVPGNDMTQVKTILGTVDKLGTDYISIAEGSAGYSIIGNNTIAATENELGICSYTPNGDLLLLYDKNDEENALIDLNKTAINAYLTQSKYMICGGTFRTELEEEQKYKGDYGLGFELRFLDNNTGEIVTRTYLVNVNEMTGNPYNYISPEEQKIVFEIDGENFQEVSKIYLYGYDFAKTDSSITDNDIFVSNIILEGAEPLTDEEIAGNSLVLITSKGIYFDDNDAATATRTIQAEVKINFETIASDAENIRYYWFKQNNQITTASEKYNRYGGQGWECLNDYSVIDDSGDVNLIEWHSGPAEISVSKADIAAKENTYKCVVIYDNTNILTKNVVIYNYSSSYDISIISDSGIYFSYDVGHPTLTCLVNGETPEDSASETWTYAWGVTDNNNKFITLEETTERNTTYHNAEARYEELKAGFEDGTILMTSENQQEFEDVSYTVSQYNNSIMRVEDNIIYNLRLSDITEFSTYSCFVYRNGTYVGRANITIVNSLNTGNNSYSLVINGGNQVFKYNEDGISPTSKSLEVPQELYPLSFTLFDESGKEISVDAIKLKDILWTVPTRDTMIKVSSVHGNPMTTNDIDGTATYTEYRTLYFDIDTIYKATKTRNTIQLTVTYKDRIITTKTDLIFMKEGESGSNGTNFVCRIVPNVASSAVMPLYPIVTYNNNAVQGSTNPVLNYTPVSSNLWFRVELWKDGEQIYTGVTSGTSTENKSVSIAWEILKNKYDTTKSDYSNFSVNKTTGAFSFDPLDVAAGDSATEILRKENPANIAKCTLTYDGVDYYATMPIILVKVNNTNSEQYKASLVDNTGFRYAMYTTDGQYPIYDSANPFELKVTQIESGDNIDISTTTVSGYSVDYSWDVKGLVYANQWKEENNLIEKSLSSETLAKNQKRYKPIDTFNGYNVSNALLCSIQRNSDELMTIHIPIHLYLNKYGNSAMNGWDGNHIEINEEGGFILAPQVGAGKKNNDNSFTGIFMGDIQEAGKTESEYGLYGYNAGERTIALSAEDGSARFGKSGGGQIIIDPSSDSAILKSGNYVEGESGMLIDLTEPSITFGSGNFYVESDGTLHATAIDMVKNDLDDLSDVVDELDNATKYLTVLSSTNTILFGVKENAAQTGYYPLETTSYTIQLSPRFRGEDVLVDASFSSNISGITRTYNKNNKTLTFGVNSSNLITNIDNIVTATYTYQSSLGTTYTDTQQYVITLVPQGEDGQSGTSSYVFFRYSANSDGSDMTATPQSDTKYLGVSNTTVNQAPTSPSSYTWSLIQGAEGTSPYTGFLTNETHTYVYGTAKTVTTQLRGFYGSTEKTVQILTVNGKTPTTSSQALGTIGMNFLVSSTAYAIAPTISFISTTSLPQGASEQIPITYKINGNDLTYTTYFSYASTTKGADGDSAKLVTISASSNYFKKAAGETSYDPSEISLIPYFTNVSYNKWQYSLDGGSTWTDVSSSLSGVTVNSTTGVLTITNQSFFISNASDSITFKCLSSDSAIFDNITLLKVSDGEGGTSPYHVLLTNEAQTLAGTQDHAVATTFSTSVLGFYGAAQQSTSVGTITGLPTGMTASISNNNTNNTSITFTVTTSMTSPSGDITIPITIGSQTINKILSYSVSYTGDSARTYEINPSVNTIVKGNDGVLNPSTLTFTSYYIDGNSTTKTAYSGTWWIQQSTDGTTWTNLVAASTTNATSKTVTPSADAKLVRAYLGPTSTTPTAANALDIQTVPILTDIDAIEIGGRNLVLGTRVEKEGLGTGTSNSIVIYNFSDYGYENIKLDASETYTISFNWKADETLTSGSFYLRLGGSPYTSLSNTIQISSSNLSGHEEYSFEIPSTITNLSTTDIQLVYNITLDETLTISNLKIEKGNTPTDWTSAPEDVETSVSDLEDRMVISSSIQYTITEIGEAPDDNSVWTDNHENADMTKLVWQRTVLEFSDGTFQYSSPGLITEKKLVNTVTQYAGSTSATTAPTSGWSTEKPTDVNQYIWTRIQYNYSYGDPTYGTPTCDTLTKKLQDNLTASAQAITSGLENGYVKIYDDCIYLLDTDNPSLATQAICLGKDGITFAKVSSGTLGWNESTHTFSTGFTSVWGIGGTFDAQSLNVININASEIQDGILELGKTANVNGQLNIYTTNANTPTVIADGSGIIVNLDNGGQARITAAEGLVVTKGDTLVYGSNSSGDAFEAEAAEITNYIDFPNGNIRQMSMTATVDSVTHRGVGFIRIS